MSLRLRQMWIENNMKGARKLVQQGTEWEGQIQDFMKTGAKLFNF